MVGRWFAIGGVMGRETHQREQAEVAHRVQVGQMVAEFELTRAAWTEGELTTSHVNVIAKTRSGARADVYFRA